MLGKSATKIYEQLEVRDAGALAEPPTPPVDRFSGPRLRAKGLTRRLLRIDDDLHRRFDVVSRHDPHKFYSSAPHIMSGMEAGYYAYIWEQVFAEELYEAAFSRGRHADVDAWDRFRRCILEPGGSKDEFQMLRDFIGHEPTSGPLLASLGLQ